MVWLMNLKIFLKQYIKMFAQNCMLPLWYRVCCRRPVIPGLIVFADAHHDGRPENMELLYRQLEELNQSGQAKVPGKKSTARQKRFILEETYLDYQNHSPTAVLRHMFAFMKLYAQADCVVICDNFLPVASCKKRKGTRVIQLWHACGAFKKFGYDTADDIPSNYRGNVFKNTDLVTVSAKACVKPFASAMRLPETCVRPLGVSRTDVYFQKKWQEECRREFYGKYPEAKGKKVVLWAPTFRGNPGAPELIDLDLKKLQEQLGEEWLVLSRVHPHMHEKYKETDCPIMTERLFPVIDVLIGDYSSLIFEYLLFDRPLVLYVPDLREYQEKRGFYLEFQEIPGFRVKKEEALPMAVQQEYLAYRQENTYNKVQSDEVRIFRKQREQFLETYMESCDGHATDRIVEYVLRLHLERR